MVVAQLFAPTSRYLQGLYHADHFDRPPFVLYLLAAKTGSNNVGHRKDMKDDFNRGARRKIQAILRLPHLHLQAKIQKVLNYDIFTAHDWAALLTERLKKVVHGNDELLLQQVDWRQVFQAWRTLGVHHAMAMIKTTSGSWCTSRRFHEQTRLKCIVGCDAPDSWMHYLHCSGAWWPTSRTPLVQQAHWKDWASSPSTSARWPRC